MTPRDPDRYVGGWICGCIRRAADGRITHIREQAATRERCPDCGITREQSIARELVRASLVRASRATKES